MGVKTHSSEHKDRRIIGPEETLVPEAEKE